MNNFIFENATKTFFGKGCVKEYLSCLAGHYGETVLLAYGGGSVKKNGVYDEVMKSLKEAGKRVVEFPGISANPTYAKVLEGAKLAKEEKADLILGMGGGSVMDCCKAISLAAVLAGVLGMACGNGHSDRQGVDPGYSVQAEAEDTERGEAEGRDAAGPETTAAGRQPEEAALGTVTEGAEEYRGFVIDNVFHSASEGDIH